MVYILYILLQTAVQHAKLMCHAYGKDIPWQQTSLGFLQVCSLFVVVFITLINLNDLQHRI